MLKTIGLTCCAAILGFLVGRSFASDALRPGPAKPPGTSANALGSGGHGRGNPQFGLGPQPDTQISAPQERPRAESAQDTNTNEFPVTFDNPDSRRNMDKNANTWADRYLAAFGREHEAIYDKFGLDDETKNRLKQRLGAIEKARSQAESYVVQLDMAKSSYDQQMKNLLGAEGYEAYKTLEAERPAQHRLTAIQSFLEKSGGNTLSDPQRQVLAELLKDGRNYPDPEGPYGSGVRASAHKDGVARILNEDLARLQNEFKQVVQRLPGTDEWTGLAGSIQNYYAGLIGRKVEEIDSLGRPPPSREEMERRAASMPAELLPYPR